MIDDLPALQVVLPLVAAPLCLLLRRGGAARLLAVGVSWTCLAIAGGLLHRVLVAVTRPLEKPGGVGAVLSFAPVSRQREGVG